MNKRGAARHGIVAVLFAALIRRLRWHFGLRVCGVYAHSLTAPAEPDAVVPGFTWRLFDKNSADALLALPRRPEMHMSDSFVRTALDKGDVCEALIHEGELVSCGWHAFTPTHDVFGVYAEFPRNFRYSYHAYTLREHRGQHWPRIFMSARDRFSIARGCTHSIAYIALDNYSSIRAATAAGHDRVGYAGFLKWRGLFIPFRSPGARRHGFRFFIPRGVAESASTSSARQEA